MLIRQCPGPFPRSDSTTRHSYAWNYREHMTAIDLRPSEVFLDITFHDYAFFCKSDSLDI